MKNEGIQIINKQQTNKLDDLSIQTILSLWKIISSISIIFVKRCGLQNYT